MSVYIAYCNTNCNIGQPYWNILQFVFYHIVSPLCTNIILLTLSQTTTFWTGPNWKSLQTISNLMEIAKVLKTGKKHWEKSRKCFLQVISAFPTVFLAHLSTTCSGGAIVTGHRPSSVRPSVRLSVRLSVCPSVRPSICPSVNNFFKNLLLQNQKANLDKTWQECSLGEALQKLLKEFNSNKNSGCHGNKMAENGKNL